ncbi:unnamed protein product [Meloidogyne enterolobii]|uniref:Uncharacterized protein n=1 Tax=Meloidogyne enterolobii TaxID=390850 RepID=A0ACB1AWI9_MELEN
MAILNTFLKFFLKKFFNGLLAVFLILNKNFQSNFLTFFILQNCIDYLKMLHYSIPSLQFVHYFIFPVFFKTN